MPENFFVLSKENLDLAVDEIIAITKGYDRFAKINVYSNLVLVQTKISWKKIHQRASYVKNSGQIVKKLSNLFLDDDTSKILHETKTFACKVLNLSKDRFDPVDLEKSMGDMISKYSNAKVSLKEPDFIVYLIAAGKRSFFGFSTKCQENIRPKKSKTHPNQLDWRLSRAMINLCGLREDQTVCDPFCGTGTTLLEAESMGIHAIGIDLDKKMFEIARNNIKENGYSSEIINDDFRCMTEIVDKFDGLVTDVPYGQNSKITEKPETLMRELLKKLPKKKRFAIMCKKEFGDGIKMKNIKKYTIYRHKSLTRTILVK